MRLSHSLPWLIAALLAVSFGPAACGARPRQEQAAAASGSAPTMPPKLGVSTAKYPPVDTSRIHFASPAQLELTPDKLRAGYHVLLRNPTGRVHVRVFVRDSLEELPLSQVVSLSDTAPTLRTGTNERPGTTLLKLSLAPGTPKPGIYEGRLVVSDSESAPLDREIRLTVPAPLPRVADASWNASIYKLAPVPTLRAVLFDNAEMRCARDSKDRQGFSASRLSVGAMHVMGTCLRDNVLPLEGAVTRGSKAADDEAAERTPKVSRDTTLAARAGKNARPGTAAAEDGAGRAAQTPLRGWRRLVPWARVRDSTSIARPKPPHRLLGVLKSTNGDDNAMVWWTGDPLEVGRGRRKGVELQFTSFDLPETYEGTINLAGAGADGTVELSVRVTHDWPMALIAIGIGVWLSAWLRGYVRTRRAVLKMQETAEDLVSRIEDANQTLRLVDSKVPGYQTYPVDAKLPIGLRQLERQFQQHVYDGTVLEPGKPEHDALQDKLERYEADVAIWEGLEAALAELRAALDRAEPLQKLLRSGDVPRLLFDSEKLFAGSRLDSEAAGKLEADVRLAEEAVACWNDVAQNVVTLRSRIGTAPDREKARQDLALAIEELCAAQKASAARDVGERVKKLGAPFESAIAGIQIFGLRIGGKAALAGKQGPLAAAVRAEGAEVPGADGRDRAATTAALEEASLAVQEIRRREKLAERKTWAAARRKRNDRRYFWLTLAVATATGLNQLYFADSGFGSMRDYLVALLWGFGTKLGLDTVRASMESGRLPWPARKDAVAGAAGATAGALPAADAGSGEPAEGKGGAGNKDDPAVAPAPIKEKAAEEPAAV